MPDQSLSSKSSSTSQTIDTEKGHHNHSTQPDPLQSKNNEKLLMQEIPVQRVEYAGSIEQHDQEETKKPEKESAVPIYKLFRFATPLEAILILCACVLSAGVGAVQPISIIIFGKFMGTLGASITSQDWGTLAHEAQPLILTFVYLATGNLVAAYTTNCLWVLTGKNQVRRIRSLYVHAVLRQEMSWFDKAEEGSLTTRLASGTQLIQDGISEKFGYLVMCIGKLVICIYTGLIILIAATLS